MSGSGKRLAGLRELVANLVAREMKSRYKGSALGVLWSVLVPLFMAVIYVLFFRFLVGRGAPTESIIIGIFGWQFTAVCIQNGMTCVTGNGNLIKKVAFPRAVLPLSVILAGVIDYLLSLAVQLVLVGALLSAKGQFFGWSALLLPLVLMYHAIVNFGFALLVSALNVYFRDTQHLVGVLISAFFFLSPAMYDLEFVRTAVQAPAWVANLYMLNPMASILSAYRLCLLPEAPMIWNAYTWAGLMWPLVFVLLAAALFHRMQRNFADYV